MSMDRFKFRVWNGREQCVDHRQPDKALIDCDTGKAMYYNGFASCLLDVEDAIIEQCTGLKDMNGVLIYEGDVVQGEYITGRSVVRWDDHQWYVDEYDNGDYYQGHVIQASDFRGFEIIGNIHENPELLEMVK